MTDRVLHRTGLDVAEREQEDGGACKTFIFDAMVDRITIEIPCPFHDANDLKTNFVWVFRTRRQV